MSVLKLKTDTGFRLEGFRLGAEAHEADRSCVSRKGQGLGNQLQSLLGARGVIRRVRDVRTGSGCRDRGLTGDDRNFVRPSADKRGGVGRKIITTKPGLKSFWQILMH